MRKSITPSEFGAKSPPFLSPRKSSDAFPAVILSLLRRPKDSCPPYSGLGNMRPAYFISDRSLILLPATMNTPRPQ